MKKTFPFLFAIVFLPTAVSAQQFYFRAGLGYAFPQAGQSIDGTGSPYSGTRNNSTYLRTYNLKNASFSAGVQGSIGFGYLFNDHIGIQLDVDANVLSKEYTYRDKNVLVDIGAGPILSNITMTQQAALPVVVVPSLVLQTGGRSVNIYTRFGPALPVSSKMTQNQFLENAPGTGAPSNYNFIFDIKSKFSLGFAAAAGARFKVNNKLSVWAEVSILSMSLYIKQSDLTDFKHDGRSYNLSNVLSPHTYYYSKTASVDSNGINQPAYTQPFSNAGIKAGITLSLGKHSKGKREEGDKREISTRPKPTKFR